jgi:hypothetical protein
LLRHKDTRIKCPIRTPSLRTLLVQETLEIECSDCRKRHLEDLTITLFEVKRSWYVVILKLIDQYGTYILSPPVFYHVQFVDILGVAQGNEAFLRNRVLRTRVPVYHLPVCAPAPIQANKPQFIIRLVLRPDVLFDKYTTLTQMRPSLSGAVSKEGKGRGKKVSFCMGG